MKLFSKNEKKSLISLFAMFLVVTAQTTMGTTCLILVNQPQVPQCLLQNDK